MSLAINTIVSAMNSARLLNASNSSLHKSLSRLSSGLRIVSPEDDAAGLAQSIKFDAQINRNTAANQNVQNAISFAQTQNEYLQKVQKAVNRMSEISVLASKRSRTGNSRTPAGRSSRRTWTWTLGTFHRNRRAEESERSSCSGLTEELGFVPRSSRLRSLAY